MASVQRITPCLWFDSEALEAAEFYTSIFKNSKIMQVTRYGEAGRDIHGKPAGSVLTVAFELEGQSLTALNGGPVFRFNEAISLQVHCDTQDEIDYFWDKLSAGGSAEAQRCGWLKDRYGLSWQVVPSILPQLLNDTDPARPERVMQAIFQMKKLDLAALQRAHSE